MREITVRLPEGFKEVGQAHHAERDGLHFMEQMIERVSPPTVALVLPREVAEHLGAGHACQLDVHCPYREQIRAVAKAALARDPQVLIAGPGGATEVSVEDAQWSLRNAWSPAADRVGDALRKATGETQ